MILYAIHKIPFLRNYYFRKGGRKFSEKKISTFINDLAPNETILDIGSGGGLISYLLKQKGFNVTPLDITKGNYHPDVEPLVYNGKDMPFPEKSFDCGLLLTVLHHVENNEKLLMESARVCRKVIIIEDIYDNKFLQFFTYLADSIINFLYAPCPHTNRTDAEWRRLFEENDFQLMSAEYRKVFGLFKQAIYVMKS